MLYCLMNTGLPLTSAVSNLLLATAKEMALGKKSRAKFKSSECAGVLSTKWEHGSMGTISGIEFKAEMAFAKKDTVVTFLVRSFDFELEDLPEQWGVRRLEDIEQMVAREEKPQARSKLN